MRVAATITTIDVIASSSFQSALWNSTTIPQTSSIQDMPSISIALTSASGAESRDSKSSKNARPTILPWSDIPSQPSKQARSCDSYYYCWHLSCNHRSGSGRIFSVPQEVTSTPRKTPAICTWSTSPNFIPRSIPRAKASFSQAQESMTFQRDRHSTSYAGLRVGRAGELGHLHSMSCIQSTQNVN